MRNLRASREAVITRRGESEGFEASELSPEAEGELRKRIQAILVESQRGLVATVARAWVTMTGLLGYRLRPELGASFETLALLLSAGVRAGQAIRRRRGGRVVAVRRRDRERRWRLPRRGS